MRRLPRAERREQILAAATKAFARSGFAATSLDDVATEAGVTRVILYRHFDSKVDLYRAVIATVCARLERQVGSDGFTDETLPALLRAAAADPDGFRLVFRYAAREPEFRDLMDSMMAEGIAITGKHVATRFPDQQWAAWAAMLLPDRKSVV